MLTAYWAEKQPFDFCDLHWYGLRHGRVTWMMGIFDSGRWWTTHLRTNLWGRRVWNNAFGGPEVTPFKHHFTRLQRLLKQRCIGNIWRKYIVPHLPLFPSSFTTTSSALLCSLQLLAITQIICMGLLQLFRPCCAPCSYSCNRGRLKPHTLRGHGR